MPDGLTKMRSLWAVSRWPVPYTNSNAPSLNNKAPSLIRSDRHNACGQTKGAECRVGK